MKKSVAIAFSGVSTALTVVLLLAGSVVWVLNYTMPLVCGILLIIVKESMGKKYAWMVFAASAIISALIMSGDEGIMLYILFFGYYPIIRDSIEKINSKVIRVILKLAVFNAAMVLTEIIVTFVFGIPFELMFGKFTVPFLLISANVIFFAYEKMLLVATLLYNKKFKKRIDKYLK